MGKNGNIDTGAGELAPRTDEFMAGVLALSRISRVTVALESGHGAGPALQAAASLTAHAESCVLFDRWRDNPLANLVAALFHAHPELVPAPGESPMPALRTLQARERRSFLLIFDRFEDYLAQAVDHAQVAAFDRAFVQLVNDSELDVHFLLVLDEDAEALLGRFQNDIPGLGDGCLRMPAGGIGDSPDASLTPAPDAGRASRRDRSFGMLLERLTTIAPVDEAATSRRNDSRPAINALPPKPEQAAEPAQAIVAGKPEPEPDVRHVRDDTVINETSPARQEPVFASPPAESREVPAAVLASPPLPADAPARESVSSEPPPRRGKALVAIMAVFMAVGAGLYAYKQQGPAAATDVSATAGKAASPAAGPVAAAPPATTTADRPQATRPAPALTAAPALAPASAMPAPAPAPATTPTPATPATPAAAGTIPAGATPTVYVHVRSQRERDRMQALARTLAGQGIWVVDVKIMSKGPSVADLRYFRDEDKATAVAVQKAMAAAGIPVPRLSRMNGYEGSTRPGHFEAWLGGEKVEESPRRR